MFLVLFALTSLLATRTTISAGRPVCFPNEAIEECYKRSKGSEKETPVESEPPVEEQDGLDYFEYDDLEENEDVSCLGIDENNKGLGFLGKCQKVSSKCGTISSKSLNCPLTSTCCYKPVNSLRPSIPSARPRPNKLYEVSGRDYEQLNQPDCGQSGLVQFVLGGNDVPEGALPFMVSFTHNLRPEEGWKSFCGGTLIAPDLVLTAAHCFDDLPLSLLTDTKKVRARVGVSDINRDFGSWQQNRTRVAAIGRIIKYPGYKKSLKGYLNPFNDIAIIKLSKTKGAKKYACLPTSIPEGDDENNDSSIVTGWGRVDPNNSTRPDVLQYAFIKRWSRQECRSTYDKFLANLDDVVYISNKMLCSGGKKTDSCKGDSGSPLLQYDSKSRFTIAGIVSFGPSVCGGGVPGVFTRVQSFLPWIKKVLEREL